MNNIVVVHDNTFTDVDKMMRNIDYVSQTSKAFSEEFTIYCEAEQNILNGWMDARQVAIGRSSPVDVNNTCRRLFI